MRQDVRPALNVGRDAKDALDGCPDDGLIDGAHASRHPLSVIRSSGRRTTDDASGDHAATMRNPGRHRATAGTPASRNIPSNSRFVYPRLSDTTASCRVTRLMRSPSAAAQDRKSTRLNSSHGYISYAVFCLK